MTLYFPKTLWQAEDITSLGWSSDKLKIAEKYYQSWPRSSVMILDHGRLIASWGDIQHKVKISSARKSILAMLFGILLKIKPFDLNTTIDELGIDDISSLTKSEKQATVLMVLKSRSGIYHDFIGGSPSMLLDRPVRGSVKVGEHWYYNNWDFNCAGTIFEKIFNITIPDAFIKYLAIPLGMQDFSREDFYYYPEHFPNPNNSPSRFPAYHFCMTTRDMARLGCLLIAGGCWNDQQIIPKAWFNDMTKGYSSAFCKICQVEKSGYGYYFWIDSWPTIFETNFSARGNLGKNIVVFPKRKLSVICMNHTAAPDDSHNESISSYKNYPVISTENMSELLNIILNAKK